MKNLFYYRLFTEFFFTFFSAFMPTLYLRITQIRGYPIANDMSMKAVQVSSPHTNTSDVLSLCRDDGNVLESEKIWEFNIDSNGPPQTLYVKLLDIGSVELEIARFALSTSWFPHNIHVTQHFPLKPLVPSIGTPIAIIDIQLSNPEFQPFDCPKGEMNIKPQWRPLNPYFPPKQETSETNNHLQQNNNPNSNDPNRNQNDSSPNNKHNHSKTSELSKFPSLNDDVSKPKSLFSKFPGFSVRRESLSTLKANVETADIEVDKHRRKSFQSPPSRYNETNTNLRTMLDIDQIETNTISQYQLSFSKYAFTPELIRSKCFDPEIAQYECDLRHHMNK
ncbi:hypothetical protein TRFO_26563 [Tritrichomonas foetus]|uniref:Uncharacterized protein n=1 Tax=Tritrichomonas foetus TaxID=1144522 RepID=A0A1J4K449_9EUKA|nr:hypothetical protein TRFO_26563 [Tritrichomonas foetus]|eukprot:OHT05616.1 hypothetical protein TRFO_26563 [Tritrichomonas foetus]